MVMEVVEVESAAETFGRFVSDAEPRLRRAFTLLRGIDAGRDATAEALAWAWENWDRVQGMNNPLGYLYRVGASRSRPHRSRLPVAEPAEGHRFEPGLVPALERLPDRQRTAVVLVHGCGWTHQEAAEAMGISRPTVGTHVSRAIERLRHELGVEVETEAKRGGGSDG